MAKIVYSCSRFVREIIKTQIYKPGQCYCSLRQFSAEAKPAQIKDDADITTYVKRDKEFRVGKIYTIKKLEQLLCINQNHAIDIAVKYHHLCKQSSYFLSENYIICEQNGIIRETIIKCADILGLPDLDERIQILKRLDDINKFAALLRIPPIKLEKFVNSLCQTGNTIRYLSKLLKVDIFLLSEQYVEKPFLQKITMKRVEQTVELLKKHGVPGLMIANDLMALKYSLSLIESRIIFAKQHKIDDVKTWMIRADPGIFQKYIKIRSETKSILGDKSIAEYLSQKLDCSLGTAKYLVCKLPALKSKSVKKLDGIIDYLYQVGFEPQHIQRVPKILVHSVETTKKRFKLLEQHGANVDLLYILIKSQKQFDQYYETLESTNKKIDERKHNNSVACM